MRESECAVVSGKCCECAEWTSEQPMSDDNPFAQFKRRRFWAYADYKVNELVCDVHE